MADEEKTERERTEVEREVKWPEPREEPQSEPTHEGADGDEPERPEREGTETTYRETTTETTTEGDGS